MTQFRHRLIARLGQGKFGSWFGTAKLSFEDDTVRVAVANRFIADWIDDHFHDDLLAVARESDCPDATVQVIVLPTVAPRPAHAPTAAAPRVAAACGEHSRTATRRAPGVPEHNLQDFIVGPSNELAYTAAQRVADGAEQTPHVLFIHGSCGLGKTHLLCGLTRRWLERDPKSRAVYVTAEQFTNDYIHAVRSNKLSDFRRRVRKLDLLAVDDVHFLSSKPATQEEFLHTFDAIGQSGAKVVLASDAHPKQIDSLRDALVSRFMSGMVVRIETPDFATRLQLVTTLARRRKLGLIDSAADQLARQVTGSVRELEGALTKLAALSSIAPGAPAPVGHALVSRLLDSGSAPTHRRPIRAEQIVQTVCEELGVERAQLMSRSRHRRIVLARAAIIHIARKLTTLSYPELAKALGRPNHSTIVTAWQRIDKQIRQRLPLAPPDTDLATSYDLLIDHLRHTVTANCSR